MKEASGLTRTQQSCATQVEEGLVEKWSASGKRDAPRSSLTLAEREACMQRITAHIAHVRRPALGSYAMSHAAQHAESGALHVPQRHRPVSAARCQLARVRAPGTCKHPVGIFQCCGAVACGGIPQLERRVRASRCDGAPVRTPGARQNRGSVSAQSSCAAERCSRRPQLQRLILGGSHETTSVWVPSTTSHFVRVNSQRRSATA